ncbi:MAG: pyrroline-5-carboxylate reductase [bacterium]|nr:pyrroline-5-carboxylate reductase [bacterium]
MKPTVAILGAGSMGEILALGLLRGGWPNESIVMAARRPERAREAEKQTEIRTVLDPAEAAVGQEVVIIAVKPKDVPHLLEQIADTVTTDQLVISLAAGVPIAVYEGALPGVAVIRSMPNTPAAVAEGMTAYCGGKLVDEDGYDKADVILAAVGETIRLSEDLLDAVTAISGSGPAYIFLLAESLTAAAIREGLPPHAAEKLVDQMIRGSGMLLHASEKSAFRLRGEVTSPGGTTAAAVHVLEDGGFRALMEDAVRAAADRSCALGEKAAGDMAAAGETTTEGDE